MVARLIISSTALRLFLYWIESFSTLCFFNLQTMNPYPYPYNMLRIQNHSSINTHHSHTTQHTTHLTHNYDFYTFIILFNLFKCRQSAWPLLGMTAHPPLRPHPLPPYFERDPSMKESFCSTLSTIEQPYSQCTQSIEIQKHKKKDKRETKKQKKMFVH